MKVCGPSFFSLRTIVWMFEKYYLNNKEKCSSGIDFLYFDMLLKKHGGKRNGGNVFNVSRPLITRAAKDIQVYVGKSRIQQIFKMN